MARFMDDAEIARVRRAKHRKEQGVVDALILARKNADLRRQVAEYKGKLQHCRDTRTKRLVETVRLKRELRKMHELLALMAEGIRRVEYMPVEEETDPYSGKYETVDECPVCFAQRESGGHMPGCPIARVLSAAPRIIRHKVGWWVDEDATNVPVLFVPAPINFGIRFCSLYESPGRSVDIFITEKEGK